MENLFKARITKYIKRIPKPSGKGFDYFYTKAQLDHYNKTGEVLTEKKPKTQSFLSTIMSWFWFKDKKQALEKITNDYKASGVDTSALTLQDWMNHVEEYFKNKDRWDKFFSPKTHGGESKPPKGGGEKKPSGGGEKKPAKFKLSVMKLIHGLYAVRPEKPVEIPKEPKKPKEPKTSTPTPEDKKQIKENMAEEAREGYYNEKPAEILNVGADVWGARRHNFTTYENVNVDISQMEKDGTAVAYVTKKNLFGDYGLANKDERVAKGETAIKVLASYYVKDCLKKIPPDSPEAREKYMEFCRAVQRLDQETLNEKDFLSGLAESLNASYPITVTTRESKYGGGSYSSAEYNKDVLDIIGPGLVRYLYNNYTGKDHVYLGKDKRENERYNNLMMLHRDLPPNMTQDELFLRAEKSIFGASKLIDFKIKKGDGVVFSDAMNEKANGSLTIKKSEFVSDKERAEYRRLQSEKIDLSNERYRILGYSGSENKQFYPERLNDFNEEHGTNFKTGEDFREFVEKQINYLENESLKHIIIKTLYPLDNGQVFKVTKDFILVTFKYSDYSRSFKLKPEYFKPENIESVEKDAKSTETFRPDLLIESKVERSGGVDYSGLTIKQMQEKFTDDIKFKAVQYGNSMPDAERQYHTLWTLQSMSDLADILQLPIEQISAKGKLGIAFGARGQAGKGRGALAHYEPSTKMINLSRASGFGSLAHEWGHFLDNILSKNSSGFLSTTPEYETKYMNPLDAPHGSIYEYNSGKTIKRYFLDKNAKDDRYPFQLLLAGQTVPDKTQNHSGFRSSNLRLQVPKTNENGGIAQSIYEIANLSHESLTTQAEGNTQLLESKYYNQSCECFARAFESYIADKLENSGRKNTYLSSQQKTLSKDGKAIYPQGEFRKKLEPMFDELFNKIRNTEDLQKAIDKFFKQNKNVYIKVKNPETGQTEYKKVK